MEVSSWENHRKTGGPSNGKCLGHFAEINHWVGLRENLQETPIFNGKNHGFL
jgi:hypothetical protein